MISCETCAHWLSDELSCSDACERCDGFSEWSEGDAERAVIVAAQVFATVHRNATNSANSEHAIEVLFAAVDALKARAIKAPCDGGQ